MTGVGWLVFVVERSKIIDGHELWIEAGKVAVSGHCTGRYQCFEGLFFVGPLFSPSKTQVLPLTKSNYRFPRKFLYVITLHF